MVFLAQNRARVCHFGCTKSADWRKFAGWRCFSGQKGLPQRSVDSYSNLGFSLYVQNIDKRGGRLRSFDVKGFWERLSAIRESLPYALFTFSRFIGLLDPTPQMTRWAETTIQEWQNEFDIPVAFQVLAASETPERGEVCFTAITSRFPMRWWMDFHFLLPKESSESRFINEYLIGVSHFLAQSIKRSSNLSRLLKSKAEIS